MHVRGIYHTDQINKFPKYPNVASSHWNSANTSFHKTGARATGTIHAIQNASTISTILYTHLNGSAFVREQPYIILCHSKIKQLNPTATLKCGGNAHGYRGVCIVCSLCVC